MGFLNDFGCCKGKWNSKLVTLIPWIPQAKCKPLKDGIGVLCCLGIVFFKSLNPIDNNLTKNQLYISPLNPLTGIGDDVVINWSNVKKNTWNAFVLSSI